MNPHLSSWDHQWPPRSGVDELGGGDDISDREPATKLIHTWLRAFLHIIFQLFLKKKKIYYVY